jgi:hypothetical protein
VIKTLIALAAAVALAAGCSGDDPERLAVRVERTTEAEAEPEPVNEPEPTAEPELAEPELDMTPETVLVEATWEEAGIILTLGNVQFASAEYLNGQGLLLEEHTKTGIIIVGSIRNDRDKVVEFYPNQGTLVMGEDQYEASLWESDLGGTVYDGVSTEGFILFESPRDIEWFDDVTEVRFLAPGAFDSDTFNSVTGDIDLTLHLQR